VPFHQDNIIYEHNNSISEKMRPWCYPIAG
jgi:hypothetical protein